MLGRVSQSVLLRIVGVVFVGIHVPVTLAGLLWLAWGVNEPMHLMLSVLLGTVAGLVLSVLGIWAVLQTAEPALAA